jgi:hypothetical protein
LFGSTILECAIGLVFVYLIFSLIASAIAEYFSALLDRRGEHLKHTLFNLFDNDDPQGRAFLNLFVSHPMVQALNSTAWKPTFQSADERFQEGTGKFKLAGTKWALASRAVAASGAARLAAKAAEDSATAVAAAAASVQKAQKALSPSNTATVDALRIAVENAEFVAAQAEALAAEARRTAAVASKAAENARTTPDVAAKDREESVMSAGVAEPVGSTIPSGGGANESGTQGAADEGLAKAETPASLGDAQAPMPGSPQTAVTDLVKRAEDMIKRTSTSVTSAKKAAGEAKKASGDADKAKRGLYSELIGIVSVPKYIPDRTFADVIVHVLTSPETFRALAREEEGEGQGGALPAGTRTSFWDRFGAAVGVIRGVASRLPESDEKVRASVARCLTAIDESLTLAGHKFEEAESVFSQLEKGTNELRGAIAAVPDTALREALEREVETSLRPLHALGQDILMLQRAGQAVALMADSSVKTAISAFLGQAGEDLDAFKQNLGAWYNDVMDHATGWYKRNTQRILVLIALVLCVVNNVDTVSLVTHLTTDPQLRSAAVREARAFNESSVSTTSGLAAGTAGVPGSAKSFGSDGQTASEFKAVLDDSKLPLWWTLEELKGLWFVSDDPKVDHTGGPTGTVKDDNSSAGEAAAAGERKERFHFFPNPPVILSKIAGLFISILAVSMGAPFWFDLLNKLVNVRLVGKRPEPSTADSPQLPASARGTSVGKTTGPSPTVYSRRPV